MQKCPYNLAQLNFMVPSITDTSHNELHPTKSASDDNLLELLENRKRNKTERTLYNIIDIEEVTKNYISQDYNKIYGEIVGVTQISQPQLPTSPKKPVTSATTISNNTITSISAISKESQNVSIQFEIDSNKIDDDDDDEEARVRNLIQDEIDKAAFALIKDTGLTGENLYRCAVNDCNTACSDHFIFNIHMIKHASEEKNFKSFKCFHCKEEIKSIALLTSHTKTHGIHRYFCYYCDFSAPVMKETNKHLSDTHKRNESVTVPINPVNSDPHKHMFVTVPKGLKKDEFVKFGPKLIDRYKYKISNLKKKFAISEIDMLPQQSIFNELVFCAICDYSTKVRINMQRHLQRHKETKFVPKIDPINPVPCLESGVRHYDNMINLACSSNDMRNQTTSLLNNNDPLQYIPEVRRFVCGANECLYITLNETMLKCHLTSLHADESHYKCPHCTNEICEKLNIDVILNHLRMHGAKIFKCPKCATTHYQKQIIDKHINETHPNCKEKSIAIVRDQSQQQGGSGGKNYSTTPEQQPTKVWKWKCAVCNSSYLTKPAIQTHLKESHSVQCQYQCEICFMQTNAKTTLNDHFASKHPGIDIRLKTFYNRVEEIDSSGGDTTPIWTRDPNKVC